MNTCTYLRTNEFEEKRLKPKYIKAHLVKLKIALNRQGKSGDIWWTC